jgi:hypothetical protein
MTFAHCVLLFVPVGKSEGMAVAIIVLWRAAMGVSRSVVLKAKIPQRRPKNIVTLWIAGHLGHHLMPQSCKSGCRLFFQLVLKLKFAARDDRLGLLMLQDS